LVNNINTSETDPTLAPSLGAQRGLAALWLKLLLYNDPSNATRSRFVVASKWQAAPLLWSRPKVVQAQRREEP
jgi:hypothetical protein